MSSCPRCNKRPAKRACPALRTKICAVCCATERMIELACPESCPYLISARQQISHREGAILVKEAKEPEGVPQMTERSWAAMYVIGGAIVDVQRGAAGPALRDLRDSEILEAIENTAKNVETEESGLIYEHHGASPRVDAVSRRIREVLEESSKRVSAEQRFRRREIQTALKFARASAQSHLRRGEGERSYLYYLCLFYPWPEQATKPLII